MTLRQGKSISLVGSAARAEQTGGLLRSGSPQASSDLWPCWSYHNVTCLLSSLGNVLFLTRLFYMNAEVSHLLCVQDFKRNIDSRPQDSKVLSITTNSS